MKWRMFLLVITAMFLFVAVASAHHSFAAVYDGKKTITLDGKLVQFIFRNPHSFVQVEVADERGVIQRWSVEWSAAGQLGGQGVNQQTLRVGEHVVVTGRPSRVAGELRIQMQTLKRPA